MTTQKKYITHIVASKHKPNQWQGEYNWVTNKKSRKIDKLAVFRSFITNDITARTEQMLDTPLTQMTLLYVQQFGDYRKRAF